MAIELETFRKLTKNIGMFHHSTNIGVVCAGDDLILIDSGDSPKDGEALYKTLSILFPTKKITDLLITHSHKDHCGGTGSLTFLTAKDGLRCTVWATEVESHLLALPNLKADLYWGAVPTIDVERFAVDNLAAISADKIITEEPVSFGNNISITPISLPGHFYNQVGFLVHDKEDDKKVFFLADGLFGASMIKKYWIPFMQNPDEFRKSVEKIEHTPSDFYIPSHGDVYDSSNINAIAELNSIITYETEILIAKLLKEKSLTSEELIAEVANFSGIELKLGQYILIGYTLRCYLSNLYNANLITYEIKDNKFLWRV